MAFIALIVTVKIMKTYSCQRQITHVVHVIQSRPGSLPKAGIMVSLAIPRVGREDCLRHGMLRIIGAVRVILWWDATSVTRICHHATIAIVAISFRLPKPAVQRYVQVVIWGQIIPTGRVTNIPNGVRSEEHTS